MARSAPNRKGRLSKIVFSIEFRLCNCVCHIIACMPVYVQSEYRLFDVSSFVMMWKANDIQYVGVTGRGEARNMGYTQRRITTDTGSSAVKALNLICVRFYVLLA